MKPRIMFVLYVVPIIILATILFYLPSPKTIYAQGPYPAPGEDGGVSTENGLPNIGGMTEELPASTTESGFHIRRLN